MKVKERTDVIEASLDKRFLVLFTKLGEPSRDLDYEYPTMEQAQRKLNLLIQEERAEMQEGKSQGFYGELCVKLAVRSETVDIRR